MKNTTLFLYLLAGMTQFWSNPVRQPAGNTHTEPLRIMVLSDIHFMDPSLLFREGSAFDACMASDRKMLRESYPITRAAFEEVAKQNPDLLLIPGDLTKDGERVSHEALAGMLHELHMRGVCVLVINGNHDINNPRSEAYDGDEAHRVPTVSPDEFAGIYNAFGFGTSISRDTATLSYVAEPFENLRILALDACHYRPQETGGSLPESTLLWAEEQIREATVGGIRIIAMMHHSLLEHFPGQKKIFGDYIVDDWQEIADRFAGAGLELILTGHIHAQDISAFGSGNNKLYNIQTGSILTFPCPYRLLELREDNMQVTSGYIEDIGIPLPGGISFRQYAGEFLSDGLETIITGFMQRPPFRFSAANSAVYAPIVRDAFLAHYAGDEKLSPQDARNLKKLKRFHPIVGYYVGKMWNDSYPDDNHCLIPFRQPVIAGLDTPRVGS